MRSNCLIRAWKKFSSGEATHVSFRLTSHRFSCQYATKWWWRITLAPIGVALQWLGHILWVVGCVLRWGKPIHSQWRLSNGEWREFVPEDPRYYDRPGTMPMSVIFKGKEQPAEDLNEQHYAERPMGSEIYQDGR